MAVCNHCGSKDVFIADGPLTCQRCGSLDIDMYVSLETEEPKDKKYDEGKPLVAQMKKDFPKALLYVAEVTTYGVKKYKQPGSWRFVPDALRRYEDALGRHDLAMGFEDRDEESKLLHAGHRAWNALATLEMILDEDNKL